MQSATWWARALVPDVAMARGPLAGMRLAAGSRRTAMRSHSRHIAAILAGMLVTVMGCAAHSTRTPATPTVAESTPRARAHVTAIKPIWLSGSMQMTTPELFIHVEGAIDASKRLSPSVMERANAIIKRHVERAGYMTEWPGRLPTASQLGKRKSFIIASTLKQVDVRTTGARADITCSVAIRVAPWHGVDGGEAWEQRQTAAANGSAKATTGARPAQIERGVHECTEAVIDEVTTRQIMPFLQRVASVE